jgi:hypothetical protein
MADTGVVAKQLEIAGYSDIKFEQVDAQVFVGKDLDDAVGFQLAIGPAGEMYREAGKLAEHRHDEIAAALRAGFLAHVPWVRAVSIEGQGVKLQLATPWNQLPKGIKVMVKMPRKKLGTLLLDVLRLRAPRAKVGDAVTLVTPRDKLEEFLNLLPESVKLISCPEESAQSKRRKLI